MIAHINRYDLLVFDEQFQRDAVGQVDGHGVQIFVFACQSVQPQRWVVGVRFQECHGFSVLAF